MPANITPGTPVALTLIGLDNFGGRTRNTFYYQAVEEAGSDGTDNAMRDVAAGFWAALSSALRDVTANEMDYQEVFIQELDDTTLEPLFEDTYSIPANERAGNDASEVMPPFVAWSFRYVRPSTEFRHGYKRFAGVPENLVADGAAVAAGLTLLDTLASVLEAQFEAVDAANPGTALSNPVHLEPRIISRVKNGEPRDPPLIDKPVSVVYNGMGSQNTRKAGRGE